MRRLVATFCMLFCALWSAAFIFTPTNNVISAFTPGCSASSTFLARITTDVTHRNAYDTFICGGVTDGWWAKSDAVYLVATDNTTNSLLNLVSTSFSLVSHGSNTFTANGGYASDGSTGYFDTQYTPSTAGGHLTLGSLTMGICVQGAQSNANAFGGYDGSNFVELNYSGTVFSFYMNASGGPLQYTASATAGTWMGTNSSTGSLGQSFYKNGSAVVTNSGGAVGALIARPIFISARNNQGTADTFITTQWSAFVIGGLFSSTDTSNYRTRLTTYMTAVSGSGC